MLNWSRIANVLTAFRQPIGLAFLASIGIYTMVYLDDKNKTLERDWTKMFSVQLAESSRKEGNWLDRLPLSKTMAMGFYRLPLVFSMPSYFKDSLVNSKDDRLIRSTIGKSYQSPEAFLINLSANLWQKKAPVTNNSSSSVSESKSRADKGLNPQEKKKFVNREINKKTNPIPQQIPGTESGLDMTLPIANEIRITSEFGLRLHPVFGYRNHFHSGIDFGATAGTPVLAVYGGKVKKANWQGGYGLTVVLEHHQGTSKTLYAHLSKVLVKEGEVVRPGDAIGHVGSTGYSTGPHLHLELHELTDQGWKTIDPTPRLAAAIAHAEQEQQRAWFEATFLAHEKEFYAWVERFSERFTNVMEKQ